ncbi:MAG: amino acid adenylation domain-containing protein [Lutisporaceae bacterium]
MQDNSMNRENVEDIIGLTPMQQGMLFHYLKDVGSGDYFEQLSFRIKEKACIDTLKKAWNAVAASNEVLRTVYRWDKLENPVQVILKKVEVPVSCIDAKDVDEMEKEHFIRQIRKQDVEEGVDISKEPFRVTVVIFAGEEIEMMISYHHILYDGWSSAILIKEFMEAYAAILHGKQLIPTDKLKYKEYVKWQQQNKSGQLEYWKSYLDGYEEKAVIPQNNRELGVCAGTGECQETLGCELREAMEQLCKTEKTTMATLVHTAWGILLQRYSNSDDVIFGRTVSGRTAKLKGIEGAVGLYINTLPFRVITEDRETIGMLLQKLEKATRVREAYESISLAELQTEIGFKNGAGLFDTLLVIENYPIEKQLENSEGKIKLEISHVREATNYDLTIGVMFGDGIKINIYYKQDKYQLETIKRLLNHLRNILQEIIEDSQKLVSHIEMISREEKEQIVNSFNATEMEYDRKKTIHQLFEEQAEKTPDNIAVAFEDKQLTYMELNEKANQLARLLRDRGIGADSIVGIMTERSLELIVGIMGILKAGGAYLPIDPEYPVDRIAYMLEDSGAQIILTQSYLKDKTDKKLQIIELDDEAYYTGEVRNLENSASANNLAYVIYTSGSTGKPKGVAVEHKSLNNLIFSIYCRYDKSFGVGDNCLSLTSISFDVSVFEMFLPLTNGAKLVLFDSDRIIDIHKLSKTIIEEEITFTYIPPTILRAVYELLKVSNKEIVLNKMLVGVEPIKDYILEDYLALNPGIMIRDGYGPTEATIAATMYQYGKGKPTGKNVPIGTPLNNTQIYILDRHLNVMPMDVPGELCIAGEGLSRGYINRPELTSERFVPNPFEAGKRMYKTGDLAKWLPDGNIEYLGRIDNQVKIRGYRVELGEIETQLIKHEAIKEAVVLAKEDKNNNKYVCAYIVADKQLMVAGELTVAELRKYLSKELPEYMIPSYFVQLDNIPINRNGKIDKRALPEPVGNISTGTEYQAARNEMEQKLVEIWQKVLEIENIGIYDNFFELGGHSLKAMQIVNQIHKLLKIQISFKEFFDYQTIASLGEYLKNNEGMEYEQIEKLSEQAYYELSYAQQRLWIINQKEPGNTAYNMAGRMLFKESMDLEAVKKTFEQLIERHESLRTRFKYIEDKPVQSIEAKVDFEVPVRDLSSMPEADKQMKLQEIYTASSEHIFSLEKSPLLVAELIRLKDNEYELILCMHHIVSDGWSMSLLREEFINLYEANKKGISIKIPPLKLQYKDFAAWQNKQIEGSRKMELAKSYWYEQLRDNPSPLSISHRNQGEALKEKTGETYSVVIEKDIKEKLKMLAKEQQTSLFMVLLSALNILLMDLTGKNDILIGAPGSGRDNESLERIIGYFINTIILRNQIDEEESFNDVLARINKNTLKALEYQSFPIEKIVEELNVKYPQITIFFNMLNMGDSEGQKFNQKETNKMEALKNIKFDLVFYITEYADAIEIVALYVKELFKPTRMASIMSKYTGLLEKIAENSNETVLDYLD